MRELLVAKLGLRQRTKHETFVNELVDTLELYIGTDVDNTYVLSASKSYPVEFKDDKGFKNYQKYELRRMVMRELELAIFGD